ncbi:MAG: hypothetical protein H7222_16605 [Methylotenera sp.]|nr:hypothetical protein [Oligoflexia bacterium]
MIQVGVLGSSGRMGKWICDLIRGEFKDQAELCAAPLRGGALGSLLQADVVIDFSSAAGTHELTQFLLASPGQIPALVVGSTGLSAIEKSSLETLAQKTSVLVSANFSTGLHAYLEQLKTLAPLMTRLGYKARVIETHHVHKKDAPSGTALLIHDTLAPLVQSEVPITSLREGEVIGDHEICFEGTADRIHFRHEAMDRSIFARGAVEAALWIVQKAKPGSILEMQNFLKDRFS